MPPTSTQDRVARRPLLRSALLTFVQENLHRLAVLHSRGCNFDICMSCVEHLGEAGDAMLAAQEHAAFQKEVEKVAAAAASSAVQMAMRTRMRLLAIRRYAAVRMRQWSFPSDSMRVLLSVCVLLLNVHYKPSLFRGNRSRVLQLVCALVAGALLLHRQHVRRCSLTIV